MGIPPEWADRLQDFAYYGTLGGFSALVGYLYRIVKHDDIEFSWAVSVISVLVGWYMGMVVAGLLPEGWDQQQRDSVVLLIGATGVKGFEFLIEKVAIQRIKKMFR